MIDEENGDRNMVDRIATYLKTAPLQRIIPFFLVVPLVVVLLMRAGLVLGQGTNLMIANMLLLCGVCFLRGWYILDSSLRNPPPVPSRLTFSETHLPLESLKSALAQHGYRLHRAGGYAERGWKSICTALSLFCLGLTLAVGSYDNLFQFKGSLQVGTGEPSRLSDPKHYSMYNRGFLVQFASSKIKLKEIKRFLPSDKYKFGASEIRIIDNGDRTVWQGVLEALGPTHEQDGYIYSLNSLHYNLSMIVMTNKNHLLYTDWLHLSPLVKPVAGFTHQGILKTNKLNDFDGTALYNEATERLQLNLRHRDRHLSVELGVAPDHEKTVGEYRVINQGTARLSQIDVMRVRHTKALLTLAGSAVMAGACALFSRRERVWFRQRDCQGCVIAAEDSLLINKIMNAC